MKKLSLIVLALFVCIIFNTNVYAKTIQTKETNTTATIKWTENTDTDFRIGYCELTYETDYKWAVIEAKEMADVGIKVSKNKHSYKIKKLIDNTHYVVVVRYTKNGKIKYSINNRIYTKMPKQLVIDKDTRYRLKDYTYIYFDYIPGAKYEIIATDEEGNIIFEKTDKDAYESFVCEIPTEYGKEYTVKARAVRKVSKKYRKIEKKYTQWSKPLTFIAKPTLY